MSRAANGRACGNKALRSHTCRCSHTNTEDKQIHYKRRTKQGDPLCTLLFNSLLQHIMNPRTEKWNRDNHGVRLVEHHRGANLSNLRVAGDILPISRSLKHSTMLNDLITATRAHGLQLASQRKTRPRPTLLTATSKKKDMSSLEENLMLEHREQKHLRTNSDAKEFRGNFVHFPQDVSVMLHILVLF